MICEPLMEYQKYFFKQMTYLKVLKSMLCTTTVDESASLWCTLDILVKMLYFFSIGKMMVHKSHSKVHADRFHYM